MSVKEDRRKKLASRYTRVIYVSRPVEFEGHAFPGAQSSLRRISLDNGRNIISLQKDDVRFMVKIPSI